MCILVKVFQFEITLSLHLTFHSFKMLLVTECPHWMRSVLSQGKPGSVKPVSLSNYSQLNLSIMLVKKVWMSVEEGEIAPEIENWLQKGVQSSIQSRPPFHKAISHFLPFTPHFFPLLLMKIYSNRVKAIYVFSLMFSKAKQEYVHFQVTLCCD